MKTKSDFLFKRLLPITFLLLLFSGNLFAVDYCADINKDNDINILDIVSLLNYKYKGGTAPSPLIIGDADGNGYIDILDIVRIIDFKYKGGNPPDCNFSECTSTQGECFSRSDGGLRYESNGTMRLVIDGHDLYIYHDDAYYNCCLLYNTVYSVAGNGINIYEYDMGPPCDCICYFDLETIIEDIPTGQYFVTLFDIPGDTVGFQSIEIFGESGELTNYASSGCQSATRGDISYTYADGNLTMRDIDPNWNCAIAALPIEVEFYIDGNTLIFLEKGAYTEYMTYCLCQVEVTATASNISPGTYEVEIYRIEFVGSNPFLVDRRTIILE